MTQPPPLNPPELAALLPAGRTVLRVAEVAKLLAVTERHVIHLIERGELGAVNAGLNQLGRPYYSVPVNSLERFLRERLLCCGRPTRTRT